MLFINGRMHYYLILAGALGLSTGCQSTSVSGQVTDLQGRPLQDALVSQINAYGHASTGENGQFDLKIDPGKNTLAIAQEGFLSQETTLSAEKGTTQDLGSFALVPIPQKTGLFLYQAGNYLDLKPSRLERRRTNYPKKTKAFCLDKQERLINSISAGEMMLFDNKSSEWRIWLLDAQGCTHQMERIGERWVTHYAEQPTQKTVASEGQQQMLSIGLVAGQYFIADWEQGFFRKSPIKDEHGSLVTGYHFKVE